MSEYQQSRDIENEAERLRRIGGWANEVTLAALTEVVESGAQVSSILVAGCGTGSEFEPIAAAFPDAEVVGVDQSDKALEKAKSTELATSLVHADISMLSEVPEIAGHEPFDLFFARQVLFHLQNPGMVLEEAKKIVRPGGAVFAQEPDWDVAEANWTDFDIFKDSITKAMRAGGINPSLGKVLRELLETAGVEGVTEKTHTTKVTSGSDRWETLGFLVDVARGRIEPFLEEYGIASADELKTRLAKAKEVPSNFFIPPSWVVATGTLPR